MTGGVLSEKRADYPMTSLRPAKAINHIFDELVEEEEILWCPSHLIPALFAATAVDVAMFESADRGIAAGRIAKFRLRISMVAMKELSAHWPVCGWVFRLFAKIIRDRHLATTDPTVAGDPRSPSDLMLEGLYSHSDLDSQPSMSLFDTTIEIGDIFSQFVSEMPE
ncbi:hypothetical protein K469DRAFT_689645 [Zopfia rhizophila CBS 207.26]|uniref:Uncharacterized protein n=1 Tax=Zopfia rhizophila CBS 207.26 TaxID=1314779 RepID=A0A6A6DW34_9PEZI|nr:hypothetical protein K469DRAFT_689645 [Zopfia rhizophila CBS 207.26]